MLKIIPCKGGIDVVEAKVDRLHITSHVKWRSEPRVGVILLASRMRKIDTLSRRYVCIRRYAIAYDYGKREWDVPIVPD